jgi:hypothetical protein
MRFLFFLLAIHGFCDMARFNSLLELSIREPHPYFAARGVEESEMNDYFQKDLFRIAEGLDMLFEKEGVIDEFLGEYRHLLDGFEAELDHVGRELYGPISVYLPLLESIAPELHLKYLHSLVFPSTEVVKRLQSQDPALKGVTIARIFLEEKKIRSLELFQPSLKDEKQPQHIQGTIDRLSSKRPVDHIAIRVSSVEDVQTIHNRILAFQSETLIPAMQTIAHNSGDGSAHTKAYVQDKVVEFVTYRGL